MHNNFSYLIGFLHIQELLQNVDNAQFLFHVRNE